MHDDSTVLIPLTRGKFALVDAEDAERVLAHRWFADSHPSTFYAGRYVGGRKNRQKVYLHQFIMGAKFIDHVNRDGLDCRKQNLRHSSKSLNAANTKMRCTNTSGFRGVSWDKSREKWIVSIRANNTTHFLGRFDSAEEAARAYDLAAAESFGDHATLNFP